LALFGTATLFAPCFLGIGGPSKRDVILKTEDYLIETADRCTRLARAGREIAADLEAMSNELMAKAVELDTTRQKKQKTAR
jgi:hypothetical protein